MSNTLLLLSFFGRCSFFPFSLAQTSTNSKQLTTLRISDDFFFGSHTNTIVMAFWRCDSTIISMADTTKYQISPPAAKSSEDKTNTIFANHVGRVWKFVVGWLHQMKRLFRLCVIVCVSEWLSVRAIECSEWIKRSEQKRRMNENHKIKKLHTYLFLSFYLLNCFFFLFGDSVCDCRRNTERMMNEKTKDKKRNFTIFGWIFTKKYRF